MRGLSGTFGRMASRSERAKFHSVALEPDSTVSPSMKKASGLCSATLARILTLALPLAVSVPQWGSEEKLSLRRGLPAAASEPPAAKACDAAGFPDWKEASTAVLGAMPSAGF